MKHFKRQKLTCDFVSLSPGTATASQTASSALTATARIATTTYTTSGKDRNR